MEYNATTEARIYRHWHAAGHAGTEKIIGDDLRAVLLSEGGDTKLLNTFLREAAYRDGPRTVQEVAHLTDGQLLNFRMFGPANLARLRALIPYEPTDETRTDLRQYDILGLIYIELKAIRELLEADDNGNQTA